MSMQYFISDDFDKGPITFITTSGEHRKVRLLFLATIEVVLSNLNQAEIINLIGYKYSKNKYNVLKKLNKYYTDEKILTRIDKIIIPAVK
jgi:ribosomal protein S8E